MNPVAIVGYCAVALAVVGWLMVSFSEPGQRRTLLEWLSASAIYLALAALFFQLIQRSWASDSTAGLIGFGLLLLVFSGGLLVSLVQALLGLRRRGAKGPDVIT